MAEGVGPALARVSLGLSSALIATQPRQSPHMNRTMGLGSSPVVRSALGPQLTARMQIATNRTWGRSMCALALDLAAIAASIAVGQLVGGLFIPAAAAVYVGIKQRHLSNLTHECIHMKLVPSRSGNRFLGYAITMLLAEPFGPYRRSHLIHHARLGRQEDPKLQGYLSRNALIFRASRREFFVHTILKNALWDLPKTAATTLCPGSWGESLRSAVGRASFWTVVVGTAAAAGVVPELVWYWIVPLVFVRPVVTWLTDLGNHAGVVQLGDPLFQTRGWTSHAMTRHIFGGHLDDMYHPIHHWCPNIPWHRLPAAHGLASAEFDRWEEVPWCSGFFFRRRSTPDIPCVLDDILARLAPALRDQSETPESAAQSGGTS